MGTYVNPVTGAQFRMEGGIIASFPATTVPGVTYEAMLDFETISSLVDSGVFNPPQTSTP